MKFDREGDKYDDSDGWDEANESKFVVYSLYFIVITFVLFMVYCAP